MRIVMPGLAFLTLISCGPPASQKPEMTGAYKMVSRTLNDGERDSVNTGLRQLKIFVGDFMMYVRYSEADSLSFFGISTYTTEPGKIMERRILRVVDSTLDEEPVDYSVKIEKTETGYKQVIPEVERRGKKYSLTEEYENVSTSRDSRLDGAWKLLGGYSINGKDTTRTQLAEYKAYFGGHFMYGLTYVDAFKKIHTRIGYGSHDLAGDNTAREIPEVSSYPETVGKTYTVNFEFLGRDKYRQTLSEDNGTTTVEEYERVK